MSRPAWVINLIEVLTTYILPRYDGPDGNPLSYWIWTGFVNNQETDATIVVSTHPYKMGDSEMVHPPMPPITISPLLTRMEIENIQMADMDTKWSKSGQVYLHVVGKYQGFHAEIVFFYHHVDEVEVKKF